MESERARTGESFKTVVNRLLRKAGRGAASPEVAPALPELPGRPLLDVTDVSAVLATLDDDRRAERALP